MKYSIGQDMIFLILALVSSLALLSEHPIVAFVFFGLAIVFVVFEHDIFEYVRSA